MIAGVGCRGRHSVKQTGLSSGMSEAMLAKLNLPEFG
jgi:hypothetical protein